MTFKELELIDPLLLALEKSNYTIPSPIQLKCIPIILQGKDILDVYKRQGSGCVSINKPSAPTAIAALAIVGIKSGRPPVTPEL